MNLDVAAPQLEQVGDAGVERLRLHRLRLVAHATRDQLVSLPPVLSGADGPSLGGRLADPVQVQNWGSVGRGAGSALPEAQGPAGDELQAPLAPDLHRDDPTIGHVEDAQDVLPGHVVQDACKLHEDLRPPVAVRIDRPHRARIDAPDSPGSGAGGYGLLRGRAGREHGADPP